MADECDKITELAGKWQQAKAGRHCVVMMSDGDSVRGLQAGKFFGLVEMLTTRFKSDEDFKHIVNTALTAADEPRTKKKAFGII